MSSPKLSSGATLLIKSEGIGPVKAFSLKSTLLILLRLARDGRGPVRPPEEDSCFAKSMNMSLSRESIELGIPPESLFPEARRTSSRDGRDGGRFPSSIFSLKSRKVRFGRDEAISDGIVELNPLKAMLSFCSNCSWKMPSGRGPRMLLLVRYSSFSPKAFPIPSMDEIPV